MGTKFGCDPREEAVRLIQCTKDLGLNLHGFSFHVGTPCRELEAYRRGIEICAGLIDVAKTIGCRDVRLIDIGGGFTADCETEMDKVRVLLSFRYLRLLLFRPLLHLTLYEKRRND